MSVFYICAYSDAIADIMKQTGVSTADALTATDAIRPSFERIAELMVVGMKWRERTKRQYVANQLSRFMPRVLAERIAQQWPVTWLPEYDVVWMVDDNAII